MNVKAGAYCAGGRVGYLWSGPGAYCAGGRVGYLWSGPKRWIGQVGQVDISLEFIFLWRR
jgi:hypothetical protein